MQWDVNQTHECASRRSVVDGGVRGHTDRIPFLTRCSTMEEVLSMLLMTKLAGGVRDDREARPLLSGSWSWAPVHDVTRHGER